MLIKGTFCRFKKVEGAHASNVLPVSTPMVTANGAQATVNKSGSSSQRKSMCVWILVKPC